MKTIKALIPRIGSAILIIGGVALTGCASTKHSNTESMLSAAGFHTMTPQTAQQQVGYADLPAYEVQRHDFNGRVVYAYKDEKAGVCYVGDESNYQRYQQMAFEQQIANQELAAAEMNQNAAMNWGYWGYWGPPGVW